MKIYDLVEIRSIPCQWDQKQGIIAIIVEINSDVATIEQLELTGNSHNETTISVDNLIVVNLQAPAIWRAAYAVWKGKRQSEVLAVKKNDKIIDLVAIKYGITPDLLKDILTDLEELGIK